MNVEMVKDNTFKDSEDFVVAQKLVLFCATRTTFFYKIHLHIQMIELGKSLFSI